LLLLFAEKAAVVPNGAEDGDDSKRPDETEDKKADEGAANAMHPLIEEDPALKMLVM